MHDAIEIAVVLGLFAIGLRMSAFFSGSETGFYRLSLPRLGIDAQAGDKEAAQLLWFSHRPANFVATTLVGNNVANYLITLAVTHAALLVFGHGAEQLEVLATLATAPIVFMFGELLPKNVYYRAPLALMRRQIRWMQAVYWLAWPASAPLVMLTRLIERLAGAPARTQEMLPGRGRFLQVISHGHHEGLLSPTQSAMASGVLVIAAQSVRDSMIPSSRVLGVVESAPRDEILEFGRRYGTPAVALYTADSSEDAPCWTAYVRVGELLTRTDAVAALRHVMPQIPSSATKLEALATLSDRLAAIGAVVDDDGNVLGTISQRGLIEQLFRPPTRTHHAVGEG